jgi:hypothetical protein
VETLAATLSAFCEAWHAGTDPQKAHGSPKSLTVATPARNSHVDDLTPDDFDEALTPG